MFLADTILGGHDNLYHLLLDSRSLKNYHECIKTIKNSKPIQLSDAVGQNRFKKPHALFRENGCLL